MWDRFRKTSLDEIKKAAEIVSKILSELEDISVEGKSIKEIESFTEDLIKKYKVKSVNKGYYPKWAKNPFPSVICISIDDRVVHCPPGNGTLKEGQIVKYDLGIKYKSQCADAALTVPIGSISDEKRDLVRHTKIVLEEATKLIKAGVRIKYITKFIEEYMREYGYRPIKEFGGHGIGKEMHQEPFIPNHDDGKDYGTLKEGQVICLEPIFTNGSGKIKFDEDGWGTRTMDKKPVAQFENMILVKKDGYEVLTNHIKLGQIRN